MKTLPLMLLLIGSPIASQAGEFFTLVAENTENAIGVSPSITLLKGDTAELKYVSDFNVPLAMVATIQEKEFFLSPYFDRKAVPVIIAGPALIRMQSGYNGGSPAGKVLATVEVTRAGTASNAAAIPQEAGTTWQVILEASSDMINWTPVPPGDYPAASPQRFFRTRLVKRN